MNNQSMLYCGHGRMGRTLKGGSTNQRRRAKLPNSLDYYFAELADWLSRTKERALMTRAWYLREIPGKGADGQIMQGSSISSRCVEKRDVWSNRRSVSHHRITMTLPLQKSLAFRAK